MNSAAIQPVSLYRRVRVGTPLQVRLFAIGSVRYDRLNRYWDDYVEDMTFAWGSAAFFLIVVVSALIHWTRNVSREREIETNLVRDGIAAFAVFREIPKPSFRKGPPMKYFIEFATPDGRQIRAEMHGPALASWPQDAGGKPVLILFDPARPEICRPYENMNFFAAGSGAQ